MPSSRFSRREGGARPGIHCPMRPARFPARRAPAKKVSGGRRFPAAFWRAPTQPPPANGRFKREFENELPGLPALSRIPRAAFTAANGAGKARMRRRLKQAKTPHEARARSRNSGALHALKRPLRNPAGTCTRHLKTAAGRARSGWQRSADKPLNPRSRKTPAIGGVRPEGGIHFP